jgi:hypothetical protein
MKTRILLGLRVMNHPTLSGAAESATPAAALPTSSTLASGVQETPAAPVPSAVEAPTGDLQLARSNDAPSQIPPATLVTATPTKTKGTRIFVLDAKKGTFLLCLDPTFLRQNLAGIGCRKPRKQPLPATDLNRKCEGRDRAGHSYLGRNPTKWECSLFFTVPFSSPSLPRFLRRGVFQPSTGLDRLMFSWAMW